DAAHSHASLVGPESTAEHIDAAHPLADHRILRRAKGFGADRTVVLAPSRHVPVSDFGVDWIAVLQPIKASARLHRRIEVGGGEREPGRERAASGGAPVTQAEIVAS